jgi:hypothetical protein
VTLLLTLLAPLLVAIYTWNYARWAWRQELYLGAVGLVLLAIMAIAVPGWVLWFLS